jgi:hypothetical protein
MLPDGWLEKGGGKGLCFADDYTLFQLDRPAEAWPWLKRVLQIGRPRNWQHPLWTVLMLQAWWRERWA